MRTNRQALVSSLFIAVVAVVTSVAAPAASNPKEASSPCCSKHLSATTRSIQLSTASLMPLALYASVILYNQAAQAFAATEASERAWLTAASSSTSAATGRSAPASTSTPAVAYAGSGGIPSAWMATAMCEEGGRDDPNYGYFGIKEWNGFDGYSSAGAAPLSVQLAWEAAYIGGPPDVPGGGCHSY